MSKSNLPAFKDRYRRASKLGIKLVDMDATTLAGYYLTNYDKDPIGRLLIDMSNNIIPNTTGGAAKVLLTAALRYRV